MFLVYSIQFFCTVPISYILRLYLLEYRLLTSLLVVINIPLYLYLIRPLTLYYIPQMLKRIGLGIALKVLSLFSSIIVTIIFQPRYGMPINCRSENVNSSDISLSMNSTELIIRDYVLAVQCCLSSFSIMLIYIGLYEFICSQSPHSMKGLLFGLAFALQGLFQGIGVVIIIPFYFALNQPFFICWMYYFIINILLGIAGLFVYTCVAGGISSEREMSSVTFIDMKRNITPEYRMKDFIIFLIRSHFLPPETIWGAI